MPTKLFFDLQTQYKKFQAELSQFWKKPQPLFFPIQSSPKISQLKVRTQDIAPTYKRTENHQKSQGIRAHWSLPFKKFMPPWITSWVPVHQIWQGQCLSHPRPSGGVLWEAAIGEGKASSKLLSSSL